MSKVLSAHAVSVDGYVSGRTPDGSEEFAAGKDVGLIGGGVLTSAQEADLVDEVTR